MASELIAEAITDYFGERCLDYAEGCPTCEAWAEYDRWNTRPAPAATDTGLVTVKWPYQKTFNAIGAAVKIQGDRSQAEELLAAERAEKEKLEAAWLEAEGIISDLKAELAEALRGNRYAQLERIAVQRAEKAEADNTALIHDLNRIKDHETELVNDNAAKDARIKELEQINANLMGDDEDKPRYTTKRLKQEIARATEALEAKLAAAEKELGNYKAVVKDVCESQRGTKWGKCAECIFDAIERAVLGGKP